MAVALLTAILPPLITATGVASRTGLEAQGIPLPPFVSRYATGTRSDAYQSAYDAYQASNPNAPSDNNARRRGEAADRAASDAARKAAVAARKTAPKPTPAPTPSAPPAQEYDYYSEAGGGVIRVPKGSPAPVGATPLPTPGTSPSPTPPMPGTEPTTPATPTGPQVIVYGDDAWKNNPTTQFLNGQLGYDQFHTLSGISTTDPATGSFIQAPRSMNAATMMAIARDPVRLGMIKAQMTRMNRDWDKEFADAMAAGPSGNAHGYFRTG